mgnify:CR=1 FL=1
MSLTTDKLSAMNKIFLQSFWTLETSMSNKIKGVPFFSLLQNLRLILQQHMIFNTRIIEKSIQDDSPFIEKNNETLE